MNDVLRTPSPGGPGWAEYGCLHCNASTRFTIESGIVADKASAKLGMPCHVCGSLMVIDHIQYPVDLSMSTTADKPKETDKQRETRLRLGEAGLAWDGDDSELN